MQNPHGRPGEVQAQTQAQARPPAQPAHSQDCWQVAKQGFMMGAAGGVSLGVVLGGGQVLLSGGGAKAALKMAGMGGLGELLRVCEMRI